MKGFQNKILKFLSLLLFAQVTLAQTDFQLTVSPSGNPIPISAGGGQNFLTYTVSNDINGFDEGDQTTVTFTVNPQIEPVNVTSNNPSWGCVQTTGQIVCDYFSIYPAGFSSDLIFNFTAPINPVLVNNAVNADVTNALGDPVPGNDNITSDIDFVAGGAVDLSVNKTLTPGFTSPVSPGDPISFDIEVTNEVGGDAFNVVVTDDISVNNLLFDSVNSSPECIDMTSFVQCSASTLASGDDVIFTIATTVDFQAQPGNKINTASVTANETDPDSSNNSSNLPFEVLAGGLNADLDLTMTADQSLYTVGDLINLDLTLHNPFASTGAPSNVVVTTTLPIETVFNSAQVSNFAGWLCTHDGAANGGNVTCDSQGNALPIGTNAFIEVVAVADSPTVSIATPSAIVTSELDSNPSNDTANTFFDIVAGDADLSIQMNSTSGVYTAGDSIFYIIQVDNPMGSSASPSDVLVDISLPVEVAFVNADVVNAPGWTCLHDSSINGGDISCDRNGAPFTSFSTHVFEVEVMAQSAATNALLQASISSAADSNLVNNNTNQSDVINAGVTTIAATKIASVAGVPITEVNYGQAFEYELRVQNTGTVDAQDVNITDTLPAEVTWVGTQSAGWTCSIDIKIRGTGSDIDCVLDNPLTPGSIDQITVDVVATTDTSVSSITNTLRVNGDNTGPEVVSVNTLNLQNPQASLNLSQAPSPVDPNGNVNFNVLVSNTGSNDLNGLQTINQLPSDFVYNGFSGDASWSCVNNAGTVTCSYAGSFLSNTNSTLVLETTAPSPQTNQSYVLDSTLSANELSTPLNESLTVAFSSSDYSLTLNSIPGQIPQGEVFTHMLRITNSGDFDLASMEAFYSVPESTMLTSVVSIDFNCTRISNTYSCNNSQPLLVGDSAEIEFSLRAENYVGIISANASVNADGTNKTVTTTTQIMSSSANDLALIKSASVSQVGQNEIFSYQLNVINQGSEAQNSFNLTDQLPAGVVFQSAFGNNWSCEGNSQLSCQFSGSLASGAQSELTIEVRAPAVVGSITNSANLVLSQDENLSNNTSSVTVEVVEGQGGGAAIADLAVEIVASATNVVNTDEVNWRIEVSNAGPDVAENVVVSSMFPIGFVVGNVQVINGAECTLLESSLNCEIAALAVGQSNEITIEGGFSAGFSGMLINAVEVMSDAIDNNPSNNSNNSEVIVTEIQNLTADLALQLNADSQQIQQGEVVELSMTTNNLGPERAVNAQLNGTLSGLVESVQFLNTGSWMCQANNNSISCNHMGDISVGMQSAIAFKVQTQQVVQQSQPIVFNASITSDSSDNQPGNNIIAFSNEVSRTPTEDEIFAIFQNSVGGSASETVIQTIRNVSSYCARSYFMAIEGLCQEFIEDATPENGGAIINAMEEITPNEVAAQSNSAAEIITSQFRNVGSRLAQLRGGGGSGFSLAGLNGRYGNESIPLGMLSYLNQGEEEQGVSNINDFVSPWGFFVNGSISMGERDATGRELGFDFDTFGLTAGVDYRFSATKVAGLALGYANFDSEIEDEAEMKSTGVTLTGYGSFYLKDNFYVDARISYGTPDFEQKRRINFEVDEIIIDRVATGNTDANQYSMAVSAGYHFNKNSWNITPNASLRYVRTTIDAFQETGAGGFNFAFGEQEVKSMVWSLGASVSRAISLKNGIISPQFDVNISRETENDGGLLEARFISAPDDEIFWIGTDEPDRTYGSAGLGLVFIGANGKQAYINYRSIFGLEGFTRGTINVGARFEF